MSDQECHSLQDVFKSHANWTTMTSFCYRMLFILHGSGDVLRQLKSFNDRWSSILKTVYVCAVALLTERYNMLYIYVPVADSGGKVRLASLSAISTLRHTSLLTLLSCPGNVCPIQNLQSVDSELAGAGNALFIPIMIRLRRIPFT